MRLLFSLSALAAGLVAADSAPAVSPSATPPYVRVVGVTLLGSGCPAGSTRVTIDDNTSSVEVAFSKYLVQSGPGTMAEDWRKNCKFTLNLEFSKGWQLSAQTTNSKGYVRIPDGNSGYCSNSFWFTGDSGEATDSIDFSGPQDGSFDLISNGGASLWSSCGATTAILNMNTQCYISATRDPAIISVRIKTPKISWRQCSRD